MLVSESVLNMWKQRGVCNRYDPYDFVDGFEKKNIKQKVIFLAKTCDVCPVKTECNDWAESVQPSDGLYGGQYWANGRKVKTLKIKYREDEKDAAARKKVAAKKNLVSATA